MNFKSSGTLECGQHLPAFVRLIPVHPCDRHFLHVHIHGISEEQQLDDWRQNEKYSHSRLAQGLTQLFAKDFKSSFQHRSRYFLTQLSRREEHDDDGISRQKCELGPEHAESDAFEEDSFENRDEISGRYHVRESLDHT